MASSSAAYGVEKRAQSVPSEYARKLRAHDVEFGMRASATDGGPPGPLEASLATANLQALVSGAFGEGNTGLHSFVRELAARAHVGDAVLACEAPILLIASDRGI
jgi:hypothetical protein